MKKNFGLIIILLLCICLTGCGGTKKYSINGFNINLPNDFKEGNQEALTVYLEGKDSVVTANKEQFLTLSSLGISENSTLDDYVKVVLSTNSANYEVKTKGKFQYFTYENKVGERDFFYLSAVFKSSDAFWLVTFATESKNKATYQQEFLNWADTIKFK